MIKVRFTLIPSRVGILLNYDSDMDLIINWLLACLGSFSTVTATKLHGIKLNKDDEDSMIEKEVSVVTNNLFYIKYTEINVGPASCKPQSLSDNTPVI